LIILNHLPTHLTSLPMKNLIRFALISASLGAGVHAAPFMAVGDGAELFVTGTLGIRADDNIYTVENATSDVIFDVTPGLDLTFGKDSQVKGSLTLSHAFSSYSDNSKLNTNLFNGDFGSQFDDGKLKLGFNIGYHELNQNTPDVQGLTRRDAFNTGGTAEIEISQITSVGGGIEFKHENYKKAGYTDSDSLTVPINFFYKWTPKVDLSAGYRYRDYQVDIGEDTKDHFFNIGARGEFTPKLSGKFAVGLNSRKLDRSSDETQLGWEGKLTYELSPKTSIGISSSNDYGTTPQGAQQKNLSFGGDVSSKISDEWTLNAAVNFRATNYYTRTDDFIDGTLSAMYIVNAHIRITGSYVNRANMSKLAGGDFKQNVFSLSANLRY
jgi:hypothetical protein